MDDILQKILATKRAEVDAAKAITPAKVLRERARSAPSVRDFVAAPRPRPGRGAPAAGGARGAGAASRDCRGEEGESIEGSPACELRSGCDRAILRSASRRMPVGADRRPVLPGRSGISAAGTSRDRKST